MGSGGLPVHHHACCRYVGLATVSRHCAANYCILRSPIDCMVGFNCFNASAVLRENCRQDSQLASFSAALSHPQLTLGYACTSKGPWNRTMQGSCCLLAGDDQPVGNHSFSDRSAKAWSVAGERVDAILQMLCKVRVKEWPSS